MDAGTEAAEGGPVEGALHVGAGAAIAADEALLLHEDGPEVEGDVASGGGAAGDDGSAAGEALEGLLEDFAADVFDDNVHAAFLGDFADFAGPGIVGGIDGMVCAERFGESAFGFGRAGGDDMRADLLGDLNGIGADAAGSRHDEHPIG